MHNFLSIFTKEVSSYHSLVFLNYSKLESSLELPRTGSSNSHCEVNHYLRICIMVHCPFSYEVSY